MKEMKRDMMRIQQLVGEAFNQTGALVALSDGGHMNPNRIQKTLDQTMGQFEASTLELRKLCERYATGIGGYKTRPVFPIVNATGYVEELGFGWLHIVLKTLLPHCRYQTPAWLSDTIHRLLDEYENSGRRLPYFQNALLVIDEHSCIEGRHVFDQDNKGWKAISNAIKGRLIPDDDQYTLSVALLSKKSLENVCHITLLDRRDAGDFFTAHSSDYAVGDFYAGSWS